MHNVSIVRRRRAPAALSVDDKAIYKRNAEVSLLDLATDEKLKIIVKAIYENSGDRVNAGFARPPKFAEFVLELLLPRKEAEYLVGDLAESYVQKESKYGPTKAKVWYWRQVAGSAYPLIRKAIRWGLYALSADWVRRNIR